MNFFSYESKPMQILMKLGDIIILNFIYLLCCIPIFTIGAAQAGLFNGVKVLLDKEDDSSVAGAFFKGFFYFFVTVTLAWGAMTVVLVTILLLSMTAYTMGAPLWLLVVAVAVCAIFQTLIPAFHSRFSCTVWQLIRNVWFLLFAHPLRSIATVLLIWLPVVALFVLDLYTFMALTPIWGTLFFSTVFCFAHGLLKKPFKTLIDHFNETHGIKPEGGVELTESDTSEDCEEDFANVE